MPNQIPVKPINEIEVKSEVSENDKILILDSDTEEARLASKDELKGDTWATITSAEFVWDDIVFTKDDADTVTLENAKSELEWPKGDKWDTWDPWEDWTDAWEYMTQAEYDALTPEQKMDWISRAIYDAAQHAFRTLLRLSDNVLHYNDSDELYADLQFEDWLTPTSSFPAWVSVWAVDSNDGWRESWILVNAKTNSWEYLRWLYGDDGKLYFDWGTGVFKTIATTDDIASALSSLRSELATVAFTWKSSDLNNDAGFNSCPVMTQQQYDEQTGTASDDKRYFIYETY